MPSFLKGEGILPTGSITLAAQWDSAKFRVNPDTSRYTRVG